MSDQGDPNMNDQQFNIDSMNLLQGGNMNISTNVNISNIFKNQINNNQNTNLHNIHNPDSTNANINQANNNNNNNRQTNTYGHQACNLLDSIIPYPQNKNNEDQLNNVDITQSVIPQNYVNDKNQFPNNQENIQNNQTNNNNNNININNNNNNLNNNISNQSNNIPEYRDFFNNFENNNNNQPIKKNSNPINQNANINKHNSNATNFDLESKQSARHFLNNFNSMAQQSNVSNFSMGNFELKNQYSVNQRGKVYQNQNFSNNLSVQNSYFGGENSEYRQPQMDYNFNSDLNNMRSRPLFQNEKSTNFNGNFNQINNNNNNNNNNLQLSNFATAGFSTILEGHKKMENMEISYPIQDSVFGHPHNIQNSMIISEQFQIQGSKIGASIFQTSEQNRIDQAYQQQNNFQQQQPQIFDSFMQPANHEQFRNKTDPNIDGSSDDDDDEDDEQQCENGNNTYIGIQMQSFSNEPFTQTNRYKTQTRYTQRVSNPNNKIYAKKSQKQEQGEEYQQQQQQHLQQYDQQGITKEEQKYNYQDQQYNMFNDQNNQNPENQYQQQEQYKNNNNNNNNYNDQNLNKNQDLSNQIQEMPNLSEQEYNWPYTSNNSQKRQALAKNESKNKLKKQKLKDKQQKKAKLEEFSSNNETSNQNNMFSNNNNKNLEEIEEDSSGSLSEEGKKKVALYTTVKTTQKTEIKTRNKDHKKKYRQSRHKNVFKNFGSALMRFIQYNQYFIEKKRSIFSDPELFPPINYEKLNLPIQSKHNEINQHIKNFDNWLKNQIRLERKTDFVQGWTWYESDSDEVCKFKDALRLLCYEFFENFALNYLMNSKKLDDLEIHLKSIFPFIAGINDPQTLERFKPK